MWVSYVRSPHIDITSAVSRNDQNIMRTQNSRLLLLWILCLLLRCCRGDSELIGSSQPIVAQVGDDVTLPCHLEPALDVDTMALEWTRPDLNQFVYVWRSGRELVKDIHPSYRGRTSMFSDQLKHGNISLKLSEVELSDRGTYRCFMPKLSKQALVVAPDAVSSPVISLAGLDRGALVLECRSGGWFPEPELLWLDAEGNLLSAGPTETVRGSDDLYTVSSRLTVEKRHSSRYTCRVQQRTGNHTSEAHIHITGNVFQGSGLPVYVIIGLILCIMFLLAAVAAALVVWKQRKNKLGKKQQDEETQNRSGANESEKEPLMETEPDGEQVTTQTVENQNEMNEMEAKDEETHDRGLMDEGQHEELMVERETLSDVDIEMEKLKNKLKSIERGEKGHDKNIYRKLEQIKEKEKQIREIKKQLEELETQREETEKKMMDPGSPKEAAETHQEVRDAKKVELQKQLEKTEERMKSMMKEMVYWTEQKHRATSGRDETVKKMEQLKKQENKNLKTTSDNRLLDQTNDHKTDKTPEAAENKNTTEQKGEKTSSNLRGDNTDSDGSDDSL